MVHGSRIRVHGYERFMVNGSWFMINGYERFMINGSGLLAINGSWSYTVHD